MIQHQVSGIILLFSTRSYPVGSYELMGLRIQYTPVFICEFLANLVLFQAETSGVPRSSVWITEVKVRAGTCERGYQKLQLQRKQLKDRYILKNLDYLATLLKTETAQGNQEIYKWLYE